jgi:hypothetical protein
MMIKQHFLDYFKCAEKIDGQRQQHTHFDYPCPKLSRIS